MTVCYEMNKHDAKESLDKEVNGSKGKINSKFANFGENKFIYNE